MKNAFFLISFIALFFSCNEDNDDTLVAETKLQLNFTHHWDNQTISSSDFNTIKFTNQLGTRLSIVRLRYLISKVTLTTQTDETIILDGYNLVNVGEDKNLSFTPDTSFPIGEYANISFTFGFSNEDNIDGQYQDLNSATWSVPGMLGGGYHYMQFDGKYINSSEEEENFNYHAIRAVDASGDTPVFPQDTYFTVNLGKITINSDTAIEIKMNVAEWFKNPFTWDLNELNTRLMPNPDAQIKMYTNGQSVFSLGAVN